jgi:4-coumarate--CoA ligase (photoactive yellow protein activation family)
MRLPSETVGRLIVALVAEELGRIRGRAVDPAEWRGWTPATRVDEDGLGADSLARLELVARLNRYFHMHEVGAEDWLLVKPTLGEWTEIVGESLARFSDRIAFQTSGSTGTPKEAVHETADLIAETDAHAALLPDAERIVALVPPHHIYGFLTTALGPARRGMPVLDARGWTPAQVLRAARAGDVIAATPFLWGVLRRSGGRLAAGGTGLTSTAPAPPELWDEAAAMGLDRLVELYGATETAGIGWRDAPRAALCILAHLERAPDGTLRRRRDGAPLAPPDTLEWTADGRFRPAGRRDGAVQVGGVNVWPDRVRETLMKHPLVAECAVRLDAGAGGVARLKGFVVPGPEAPEDCDAMAATLARYCAESLSAPERPVRFAFGAALPRNEIGKLRDWP